MAEQNKYILVWLNTDKINMQVKEVSGESVVYFSSAVDQLGI